MRTVNPVNRGSARQRHARAFSKYAIASKLIPIVLSTVLGVLMPIQARAQFVDDSHLALETRNFYMNRDFRNSGLVGTPLHDGKSQSKAEEWAQGFLLRMSSGLTEGTVGFGLDALGLLGVKLDSGVGTSGTGVLQRNPSTGEPVDEFSFMGLTAKAKISDTLLTIGTHEPALPVIFRNDTRLLPQTFSGAQIVSDDIQDLTLVAGQFRQVHQRDSSDYQDMILFADGATGGVASDRFNYAGATYAFLPNVSATGYRAEFKDNYSQNALSLIYKQPLTGGLNLKSDIRYFDSKAEGHSTVDNRYLGAMFTLSGQGHAVGLGYQSQNGHTGLPAVGDPWAVNLATYHHFVRATEDSWQFRYDYDFVAAGIPGLTLMARYIRGDDFRIAGVAAKERERDVDLSYVIQSGALRNLSLRLRNASYRGSQTTDIDENRLIIGYTFKFW